MLKSSLFIHLNPGRVVFFLFPLFLSGAPILAGESHHSRAPEFSDPKVLAPVPGEWSSQSVKHLAKYGDADLVIALGQQSHPLFQELILEYAKANQLKIAVEQGTCGITSGRLLKKRADIGAFCCPPGKNDRLPGLKFHSLGIAPIALIVHPDNPLQDISSQQAREIFAGEISRWSEIASGDDQLINPVGRLHCKTRPGHWRSLLKTGNEFSPRLVEVGVIPDMISQVSRNTSTIGWETPLMVDFHQKRGNVKILTIDGHSPTDIDYVLTGQYPLYRSYSLTAWSEKNSTNKQALKLIRYLQQYIEKIHQQIGFIPASRLKQAGWRFIDDELVGEPAIIQQILH